MWVLLLKRKIIKKFCNSKEVMKINILGKVKKEVMKFYSFVAWEKQ
jgi:hypothetical protein